MIHVIYTTFININTNVSYRHQETKKHVKFIAFALGGNKNYHIRAMGLTC